MRAKLACKLKMRTPCSRCSQLHACDSSNSWNTMERPDRNRATPCAGPGSPPSTSPTAATARRQRLRRPARGRSSARCQAGREEQRREGVGARRWRGRVSRWRGRGAREHGSSDTRPRDPRPATAGARRRRGARRQRWKPAFPNARRSTATSRARRGILRVGGRSTLTLSSSSDRANVVEGPLPDPRVDDREVTRREPERSPSQAQEKWIPILFFQASQGPSKWLTWA